MKTAKTFNQLFQYLNEKYDSIELESRYPNKIIINIHTPECVYKIDYKEGMDESDINAEILIQTENNIRQLIKFKKLEIISLHRRLKNIKSK